jgi:hypothetical protein
MSIDNNLKVAINKIFQSESDKNTVSEDILVNIGIDPNSLIGDAEKQLAEDALEEEEWLKKLFYDSIIAKASSEIELHNNLNDEIVEYCDITENQPLHENYKVLLATYGN